MSSFRNYWKAFWESLYEEWHGISITNDSSAEENEDDDEFEYNVGLVNILIHYLDENNKLVKHMGYLYGKLDDDQDDGIFSTHQQLSVWLEDSMRYGVYTVEDRLLIPRERVIKLVTTFEDFWISYEEDE